MTYIFPNFHIQLGKEQATVFASLYVRPFLLLGALHLESLVLEFSYFLPFYF